VNEGLLYTMLLEMDSIGESSPVVTKADAKLGYT
jgi:hypothetical protein